MCFNFVIKTQICLSTTKNFQPKKRELFKLLSWPLCVFLFIREESHFHVGGKAIILFATKRGKGNSPFPFRFALYCLANQTTP